MALDAKVLEPTEHGAGAEAEAAQPARSSLAVRVLAVAWLLFQFFLIAFPQQPMIARPIHLGFALLVLFLTLPSAKGRMVDGVLLLASAANIFLQIPALALAVSAIAVVLFSAYVLYDINRIVQGGEDNYISATLAVYLDVFNIFVNLLQLLMAFTGERD